MEDVLERRLVELGLYEQSQDLRDLIGALWLASCASSHLWAWPWRSGEGLENVFHVHLTGRTPLTVITVNDDWLVLDGLRATPTRVLELDEEAAWEFVDQVSRAMAERSVRAWTWFGNWWMAFRDAHGALVPRSPAGVRSEAHDHDHDHGDSADG